MQVSTVSQNFDALRRMLAVLLLALALQMVAASCDNDDYENAAADQHSRMHDR